MKKGNVKTTKNSEQNIFLQNVPIPKQTSPVWSLVAAMLILLIASFVPNNALSAQNAFTGKYGDISSTDSFLMDNAKRWIEDWDNMKQRFKDMWKNPFSRAALCPMLEMALEMQRKNMVFLSSMLRRGSISNPEWQQNNVIYNELYDFVEFFCKGGGPVGSGGKLKEIPDTIKKYLENFDATTVAATLTLIPMIKGVAALVGGSNFPYHPGWSMTDPSGNIDPTSLLRVVTAAGVALVLILTAPCAVAFIIEGGPAVAAATQTAVEGLILRASAATVATAIAQANPPAPDGYMHIDQADADALEAEISQYEDDYDNGVGVNAGESKKDYVARKLNERLISQGHNPAQGPAASCASPETPGTQSSPTPPRTPPLTPPWICTQAMLSAVQVTYGPHVYDATTGSYTASVWVEPPTDQLGDVTEEDVTVSTASSGAADVQAEVVTTSGNAQIIFHFKNIEACQAGGTVTVRFDNCGTIQFDYSCPDDPTTGVPAFTVNTPTTTLFPQHQTPSLATAPSQTIPPGTGSGACASQPATACSQGTCDTDQYCASSNNACQCLPCPESCYGCQTDGDCSAPATGDQPAISGSCVAGPPQGINCPAGCPGKHCVSRNSVTGQATRVRYAERAMAPQSPAPGMYSSLSSSVVKEYVSGGKLYVESTSSDGRRHMAIFSTMDGASLESIYYNAAGTPVLHGYFAHNSNLADRRIVTYEDEGNKITNINFDPRNRPVTSLVEAKNPNDPSFISKVFVGYRYEDNVPNLSPETSYVSVYMAKTLSRLQQQLANPAANPVLGYFISIKSPAWIPPYERTTTSFYEPYTTPSGAYLERTNSVEKLRYIGNAVSRHTLDFSYNPENDLSSVAISMDKENDGVVDWQQTISFTYAGGSTSSITYDTPTTEPYTYTFVYDTLAQPHALMLVLDNEGNPISPSSLLGQSFKFNVASLMRLAPPPL